MRAAPLLALLLAGPVLAPSGAGAAQLPGDVNGDGRIDGGDLVLLRRHVSGAITLSGDAADSADVAPFVSGAPDPDQVLDSGDVVVLTRAVRGDIVLPRTISGTLSTSQTWLAGDPYDVEGDLTVAPGATLTVSAGAVLRFAAGAELVVNGQLDLLGQDGNLVQLTSDGPTSRTHWDGIVISNGSATIEWTRIEYARDPVAVAAGASAVIRDNEIREFRGTGIRVGSQAVGATIEDNLIDNSAGMISNFSEGIVVRRLVDPILRNTVRTIHWGIRIEDFVEPQLVDQNVLEWNNFGVQIEDARPHLTANTIFQNGIGVVAKNAAPTLDAGNRIEGNTLGFQVQYSTSGTVEPEPVVTGNEFVANATQYEVVSRNDLVLDATGNWWGTEEAFLIAGGIEDYSDNQNASVVDFVPYLDDALAAQPPPDLDGDDTYLVGYHEGALTATTWEMIGRVRVAPGKTLTVPAGAILRVQPDLDIEVGGALLVQGTVGNEVRLESAASTPGPGDWTGIVVSAGGTGTIIEEAVVAHARRGIEIHAADAIVRNSEIHTFSRAGISVGSGSAALLEANDVHDGDGTASGVLIEAASPHLLGNEIQAVEKGIEIVGASAPLIDGGNDVHDSVYGLWLEGDGADVAQNPQPVINQNRIHSNTTANLHAEAFVRQGVQPVDARQNHWGTTVAADVLAGLTTSDGLPAPVDVGEFLDAAMQVVGPATLFAFHIQAVDAWVDLSDPQNPNRDHMAPTEGQTLTVEVTLVQTADLAVDIYEELDDVRTTPVRTLAITGAPAGPNPLVWDGRDTAGDVVQDEAYVYVVSADDGLVQDSFDPPRPEAKSDGSGEGEGKPGSEPVPFNTFRNDFWQIDYLLEDALGRVDTYAQTRQGSTQVLSQCDWFLDRPFYPGTHPMVWDGRCLGGDLLRDGNGEIHDGNYHVFFDVPKPVRPNAVVVEKTTPRVTGGPPNVEVRADPYFTVASYDQVSRIAYCLDRPARVTVKVWAPLYSSGTLRATLLDDVLQPATDCEGAGSPNVLEWSGQDPAAAGNPNGLAVASDEDVYTFTIEAVDPVQPDLVTTYRGVLQTRP